MNLSISNATSQDIVLEDKHWGSYTRYATYAVITQIKPCWVGFEPCTLEPGWYAVTEERVVRDDSPADRWQGYTDAATMQK